MFTKKREDMYDFSKLAEGPVRINIELHRQQKFDSLQLKFHVFFCIK